ncbi:amidohydrolase family protein [Frankia canadensis]|nr:amidohydrolase family protein [Frankia canadensis]
MDKIWANSGDSHFLEPEDLFAQALPPRLAERMPRSEKFDGYELLHVDGQTIRRPMPKPIRDGEFKGQTIEQISHRPPGSKDARLRLADLDEEGIWGEVTYPSLGMWATLIRDPELVREAAKALNDWAVEALQGLSPRFVATASLPLLDTADAVAELQRCAGLGYHAVFLPTVPPAGRPHWNDEAWDPLWAAAEEAGQVIAFHIGTDGENVVYRGRGGALLNFNETSYGGQRAAAMMIASGVFDRQPTLKVLVSEGGATWVPFLGDRLNESARQQPMFVWPKLDRQPKDYMNRHIYASFQHDETAIPTFTSMGYRNVMFGSDYPHMEGTYGHTQKTLHNLFDGIDDATRDRITMGAFLELFPHVGRPPAN